MKKLSVFLCAVVLVFGIVGNVNAALIDRGGGLIYDDVLNITWLQDANYAMASGYDADGYMTWNQAITWVENLTYYDSVRNVTYDDWRLPKNLPVNGNSYDYNLSINGSTDIGYNISAPGSVYEGSTGSEMAYMYYINLSNKGYWDLNGNEAPLGWGLQNVGPFINLQPVDYWSGTEYYPVPSFAAFLFGFGLGAQYDADKTHDVYAWAVRDGDVAIVPIPGAIWLLGSGLIAFIGARKRFGKGDSAKSALVFFFLITLVIGISVNVNAATIIVDGTSNIFGAGHPTVPSPIGGGGSLPPSYIFDAQPNQLLIVNDVSGLVGCTHDPLALHGPDGADSGIWQPGTNILSYGGISGIMHSNRYMFLVGVFIDDRDPSVYEAPERLDFSPSALTDSFTDLYPVIAQTFFIGDGLTDHGTGIIQRFHVPDSATRFFLGLADGSNFTGLPGRFNDNAGAFTVNFEMTTDAPVPIPSAVWLLGSGLIGILGLRRKFR